MTEYRSAQKAVRFGPFNAWAALPFIGVLLVWNYWVLGIGVASLLLFGLMEWLGYSLPAAIRAFRAALAGASRPRISITASTRRIDYGAR